MLSATLYASARWRRSFNPHFSPRGEIMIVLFNKPFQVLAQLSAAYGKAALTDFIDIPDVYPNGRLDFDSERF